MTTKHTPATPLPWAIDLVQTRRVMFRGTHRIISASAVPALAFDEREAAYIAHAANAYPKLVEALRKAIRELRIENVNADGEQKPNTPIAIVNEDFAALLRSLGEEGT